jgi:hypothetical protein
MSDVTPVNEFQIMDRADEQQILDELQGHYLTEFVYSFHAGNKDVIGLSWAGIKELAYRYGGIQVESCSIEEKTDFWLVTCKALDIVKKNSRFGVATQNKMMKRRDGSSEVDEFALQKATSKAQRNAIRALMPEIAVKQYIDKFMAEKQGKPTTPFKRVEPTEKQVPKDVTPEQPKAEDEQVPVSYQLNSWIKPEIYALLNQSEEGSDIILKPKERLEATDFKAVCAAVEHFHGKWVGVDGVWVIPNA